MRFQEKVALVTGAAHGIGRGVVQAFAAEGATVLALDIDVDGIQETARLVGERCHPVCGDVSSSVDWANVVQRAETEFGRLDILVNNATWYVVKSITDITDDEWRKTIEVGQSSVFLGMRAALPVMQRNRGGSIVNISSMNQVRFNPHHGAYASMKAGVTALTRQVALEFGQYGIRCNSISPGFIETERIRFSSEEEERLNLECYPVGRIGRVDDVSNAVLFLASDEAGFITGVDLLVDGGTTLGAVAGYLKPSLREKWLDTGNDGFRR